MTARVLYAQLLNRAKLSLQSGWMDERGRVYVYFSEAEIGQTLRKGRSAVQQALHDLDEADLIERERYAGRGGRRIYLKVVLAEPGKETDENPAPAIVEIRTSHERKTGPGAIGKRRKQNQETILRKQRATAAIEMCFSQRGSFNRFRKSIPKSWLGT